MSQNKESLFYWLMKRIVAVMLMVITALTFYQIVMRYAFNMAPSWSEELVRFLFVWLSFLGAGMGVRDKIHIGVDVVIRLLPPGAQRLAAMLVALIIFLFGTFLIVAGWDVVLMTHGQPSPALSLPMSYVYLALPAMGVLMLVYSLDALRELLKNKQYAYGQEA